MKQYELVSVPVDPIREAFLQQKRNPSEVARILGWFKNNGKPDGQRVKRTLGIDKYNTNGIRNRRVAKRTHVHYKTALALAEALCLDPWEAGI